MHANSRNPENSGLKFLAIIVFLIIAGTSGCVYYAAVQYKKSMQQMQRQGNIKSMREEIERNGIR